MDDGCDLVTVLHTKMKPFLKDVFAGTEETSTGVTRLRAMAADKTLRYPVVAINDADTKHLFDNRYGTGQSTMDGVLRAPNMLVAGSTCSSTPWSSAEGLTWACSNPPPRG